MTGLVNLIGNLRMQERSIGPLVEALRSNGAGHPVNESEEKLFLYGED